MKIQSTAQFPSGQPFPAEPMTMDMLREFVAVSDGVPGDAFPVPITRDVGNQRDPHHIVVGMRVTWEEER